jgi:outer membrane protein
MNAISSRVRYLIALAGALVAFHAHAQAEEFKIGFVNTGRVFVEANSAKAAQAKLESEFSRREKELVDMRNKLKDASDKFERDAPTLSEAQRTSRQKSLMDQDRDFQRRSREFQEDLNARRTEEQNQLVERANRVIKQLAESEKYDLVLQEAVYINPKHDITDRVIKALNAAPAK